MRGLAFLKSLINNSWRTEVPILVALGIAEGRIYGIMALQRSSTNEGADLFMQEQVKNNNLQVPALLVPMLIKFGVRMHVDVGQALSGLSFTPELENVSDNTINANQFADLTRALLKQRGVWPSAGLYFGESFAFDYIPEMDTFLATSHSVKRALAVLRWAIPLIAPFCEVDFWRENDTMVGKVDLAEAIPVDIRPLVVDAVFAIVNKFGRSLVRDKFEVLRVELQQSIAGREDEYQDIFQCEVVGSCAHNRMLFPAELLECQLETSLPALNQQAESLLEKRLQKLNSGKSLAEQLYSLIYSDADLLIAGLDDVAARLSMTPRTLQRRLKDEGASFKEVADRAKFKRASDMLGKLDYSIEDISDALGFSDRRSFTRSFTRWSGLSPSSFRKLSRAR